MTVHIGEITSEVRTMTSPPSPEREDASPWDERTRLAALLERIERDQLRTATGPGR